MNDEIMFRVNAMRPEDQKRAKLLEAIINRPEFVERVTAAVEEYARNVLLPHILYGAEIEDIDRYFRGKF